MSTLEIDGVRKNFGHDEVLRDVSISIESGEFLVLLGPSGCGKSTLLSLIAGLEDITDGEIRIGGVRVNERAPKDRDIAMVFQSYALYPTMTVRQNIEFGMKLRKIDKAKRNEAVQSAAKLLQIDKLLDRKPSQLSGGQRQRIAMGRAIVRDPKLFLFDEPLSNLDAKLRVDMRTEIKRLHDRLKSTIVYVTHDQIEAMTLATRVAVMKDGVVQQLDAPQVVYDRPANIYVARFVGSPAMNVIAGRVEVSDDKVSVVLAGSGEPPLRISGIPLSDEAINKYKNKDVLIGIRPEHLSVNEENSTNSIDAKIDVIEPTGPDTLAVFTVGGKEVVARLAPGSVAAGDTTNLAVAVENVVLFDPATEMRID